MRSTMRTATLFSMFAIAAFMLPAGRVGGAAQAKRPNIVVIVTDDMGYADIGLHGSRDIPTPNIDTLMKGGMRFTDAYVSGPYCSPTRAGSMTGRYPLRFGHEFNPNTSSTSRSARRSTTPRATVRRPTKVTA